jgi:hypothetical protein
MKRTNVEDKNISDQTHPKIQRMHDCFDLQVAEAVMRHQNVQEQMAEKFRRGMVLLFTM